MHGLVPRTLALCALAALPPLGCRVTQSFEEFDGTWEVYADRQVSQSLSAPHRVRIATRSGTVVVRASDTSDARVLAKITAYAATEAAAAALLDASDLTVVDEGGEVSIVLAGPGAELDRKSGRWVTADVRLALPPHVDVEIVTEDGDVRVHGPVGSIDALTAAGDVTVEGARGDVRTRSGGGAVRVRDVAGGDVEIETQLGEIVLASVRAGRVVVRNSSDRIELLGVHAQSIVARTESGDVGLRDVRGRVEAETASGSILVEQAELEDARLAAAVGHVTVQGARGTVRIETSKGHVLLRDFAGRLAAESGYGAIDASGAFEVVRAHTGVGDVTIHAAEGSVTAAPWLVRSSFGDVVLELPAGFSCTLDAKSGGGAVTCALPVATEAASYPASDAQIRGTINDGGAQVELRTSDGDIRVRRRAADGQTLDG